MAGALTNCRAQRQARVRTAKDIKRAGVTHVLPDADRGICQHMKQNQRAGGTHELPRTEGGIRQDSERKTKNEVHSHPVGCGGGTHGQGKLASEESSRPVKRRRRDK